MLLVIVLARSLLPELEQTTPSTSRPELLRCKIIESLSNLPPRPYFPARPRLSHFEPTNPTSYPRLDCLHRRLDARQGLMTGKYGIWMGRSGGSLLLLFLQAALVSFLQIVVNIRPKLLQLITK